MTKDKKTIYYRDCKAIQMKKNEYLEFFLHDNYLRLIEIKENKNCWFQCLHSYSIFFKTPIQLLNDLFLIIERLKPLDASMVGLVCGETYNDFLKENKIRNKSSYEYQPNNIKSVQKIVCIKREGSIVYENTLNSRYYETNVRELMKKKEILSDFSSFEAYYIGFLSGLHLYKMRKENIQLTRIAMSKPNLRLIKSENL